MILRLCYESDLDFDIAVLDKSLDLENQLANAKAGAGDPIFFIRGKWNLSWLNSYRDKRIPTFVLDGQSRVENRDKR